eukprot:362638-Chlamydomonas_euryale.AAC.8
MVLSAVAEQGLEPWQQRGVAVIAATQARPTASRFDLPVRISRSNRRTCMIVGRSVSYKLQRCTLHPGVSSGRLELSSQLNKNLGGKENSQVDDVVASGVLVTVVCICLIVMVCTVRARSSARRGETPSCCRALMVCSLPTVGRSVTWSVTSVTWSVTSVT